MNEPPAEPRVPSAAAGPLPRLKIDPLDLEPLVGRTLEIIDAHALGEPGHYRRYRDRNLEPRPDGLNAYGTANAANLFYTLSRMPTEPTQRDGFIRAFAKLQDPDDGLFHDPKLAALHCTAHTLAAIELFDVEPPRPVSGVEPYMTPAGIVGLLESLDWVGDPWNASHRGAGSYATVKLAHPFKSAGAEMEWEDAYFGWLDKRFDPRTGLLRRGCLPGQAEGAAPLHAHMAGTFHYLFNMQAARRPLPYPTALVDTCLTLEAEPGACPGLIDSVNFITVDWVYCLTRGLRESGHRFGEARAALERVARGYIRFIDAASRRIVDGFDDLHRVFGAWCALAELQVALPGLLRTRRPLRLVLDRRPFV